MKLLIVVVLASCLLVKIAEGAAGDTGEPCNTGDTCTLVTDSCVNSKCLIKDGNTCDLDAKCVSTKCDLAGTKKCLVVDGGTCAADGECVSAKCGATSKKCLVLDGGSCDAGADCVSTKCGTSKKCLKLNLASCTEKAECAIDACNNGKCGKKDGDACTSNNECASANCKLDTAKNEEKCASECAGAAAFTASVLLMLSAALTSHFM